MDGGSWRLCAETVRVLRATGAATEKCVVPATELWGQQPEAQGAVPRRDRPRAAPALPGQVFTAPPRLCTPQGRGSRSGRGSLPGLTLTSEHGAPHLGPRGHEDTVFPRDSCEAQSPRSSPSLSALQRALPLQRARVHVCAHTCVSRPQTGTPRLRELASPGRPPPSGLRTEARHVTPSPRRPPS